MATLRNIQDDTLWGRVYEDPINDDLLDKELFVGYSPQKHQNGLGYFHEPLFNRVNKVLTNNGYKPINYKTDGFQESFKIGDDSKSDDLFNAYHNRLDKAANNIVAYNSLTDTHKKRIIDDEASSITGLHRYIQQSIPEDMPKEGKDKISNLWKAYYGSIYEPIVMEGVDTYSSIEVRDRANDAWKIKFRESISSAIRGIADLSTKQEGEGGELSYWSGRELTPEVTKEEAIKSVTENKFRSLLMDYADEFDQRTAEGYEPGTGIYSLDQEEVKHEYGSGMLGMALKKPTYVFNKMQEFAAQNFITSFLPMIAGGYLGVARGLGTAVIGTGMSTTPGYAVERGSFYQEMKDNYERARIRAKADRARVEKGTMSKEDFNDLHQIVLDPKTNRKISADMLEDSDIELITSGLAGEYALLSTGVEYTTSLFGAYAPSKAFKGIGNLKSKYFASSKGQKDMANSMFSSFYKNPIPKTSGAIIANMYTEGWTERIQEGINMSLMEPMLPEYQRLTKSEKEARLNEAEVGGRVAGLLFGGTTKAAEAYGEWSLSRAKAQQYSSMEDEKYGTAAFSEGVKKSTNKNQAYNDVDRAVMLAMLINPTPNNVIDKVNQAMGGEVDFGLVARLIHERQKDISWMSNTNLVKNVLSHNESRNMIRQMGYTPAEYHGNGIDSYDVLKKIFPEVTKDDNPEAYDYYDDDVSDLDDGGTPEGEGEEGGEWGDHFGQKVNETNKVQETALTNALEVWREKEKKWKADPSDENKRAKDAQYQTVLKIKKDIENAKKKQETSKQNNKIEINKKTKDDPEIIILNPDKVSANNRKLTQDNQGSGESIALLVTGSRVLKNPDTGKDEKQYAVKIHPLFEEFAKKGLQGKTFYVFDSEIGKIQKDVGEGKMWETVEDRTSQVKEEDTPDPEKTVKLKTSIIPADKKTDKESDKWDPTKADKKFLSGLKIKELREFAKANGWTIRGEDKNEIVNNLMLKVMQVKSDRVLKESKPAGPKDKVGDTVKEKPITEKESTDYFNNLSSEIDKIVKKRKELSKQQKEGKAPAGTEDQYKKKAFAELGDTILSDPKFWKIIESKFGTKLLEKYEGHRDNKTEAKKDFIEFLGNENISASKDEIDIDSLFSIKSGWHDREKGQYIDAIKEKYSTSKRPVTDKEAENILYMMMNFNAAFVDKNTNIQNMIWNKLSLEPDSNKVRKGYTRRTIIKSYLANVNKKPAAQKDVDPIDQWAPILEPFTVTRREVGQPLPVEATEGICDGTCGVVTGRLKNEGFRYGKANISAKSPAGDWNIGHVVAITKIGDKIYIINQPQSEFMKVDFNIDNVWEDIDYMDRPGIKRHPDLNTVRTLIDGFGLSWSDVLVGKPNPIEDEDGSSMGDVNIVENVTTYKEGDREFSEGNLIGKKTKIRWDQDYEMVEFKDGNAPIIFSNKEFTPRLIEVTEASLMDSYGIDRDTAKKNIAIINEASIKSGKELAVPSVLPNVSDARKEMDDLFDKFEEKAKDGNPDSAVISKGAQNLVNHLTGNSGTQIGMFDEDVDDSYFINWREAKLSDWDKKQVDRVFTNLWVQMKKKYDVTDSFFHYWSEELLSSLENSSVYPYAEDWVRQFEHRNYIPAKFVQPEVDVIGSLPLTSEEKVTIQENVDRTEEFFKESIGEDTEDPSVTTSEASNINAVNNKFFMLSEFAPTSDQQKAIYKEILKSKTDTEFLNKISSPAFIEENNISLPSGKTFIELAEENPSFKRASVRFWLNNIPENKVPTNRGEASGTVVNLSAVWKSSEGKARGKDSETRGGWSIQAKLDSDRATLYKIIQNNQGRARYSALSEVDSAPNPQWTTRRAIHRFDVSLDDVAYLSYKDIYKWSLDSQEGESKDYKLKEANSLEKSKFHLERLNRDLYFSAGKHGRFTLVFPRGDGDVLLLARIKPEHIAVGQNAAAYWVNEKIYEDAKNGDRNAFSLLKEYSGEKFLEKNLDPIVVDAILGPTGTAKDYDIMSIARHEMYKKIYGQTYYKDLTGHAIVHRAKLPLGIGVSNPNLPNRKIRIFDPKLELGAKSKVRLVVTYPGGQKKEVPLVLKLAGDWQYRLDGMLLTSEKVFAVDYPKYFGTKERAKRAKTFHYAKDGDSVIANKMQEMTIWEERDEIGQEAESVEVRDGNELIAVADRRDGRYFNIYDPQGNYIEHLSTPDETKVSTGKYKEYNVNHVIPGRGISLIHHPHEKEKQYGRFMLQLMNYFPDPHIQKRVTEMFFNNDPKRPFTYRSISKKLVEVVKNPKAMDEYLKNYTSNKMEDKDLGFVLNAMLGAGFHPSQLGMQRDILNKSMLKGMTRFWLFGSSLDFRMDTTGGLTNDDIILPGDHGIARNIRKRMKNDKATIEEMNEWLKKNVVEALLIRTPVASRFGYRVVRIKAFGSGMGDTFIVSPQLVKDVYEADGDGDTGKIVFMDKKYKDILQWFKKMQVLTKGLKMEASNKVYNLGSITDLFQATYSMAYGQRAISEVASISRSVGIISTWLQSMEINDGAGNIIRVTPRKLSDEVLDSDIGIIESIEQHYRKYLQASADHGKLLLLDEWNYSMRKLLTMFFDININGETADSQVVVEDKYIWKYINNYLMNPAKIPTNIIQSRKGLEGKLKFNEALRMSESYKAHIENRIDTHIEEYKQDEETKVVTVKIKGKNKPSHVMESIAVAFADTLADNGLSSDILTSYFMTSSLIHRKTVNDIYLDIISNIHELAAAELGFSGKISQQQKSEIISYLNPTKIQAQMLQNDISRYQRFKDDNPDTVDSNQEEYFNINKWNYDKNLVKIYEPWAKKYESLPESHRMSFTLAFLMNTVNKSGTKRRNIGLLPPASKGKNNSVLHPGTMKVYFLSYNGNLDNKAKIVQEGVSKKVRSFNEAQEEEFKRRGCIF